MGYEEKDLSVRDATLAALESSQTGLSELKDLFKKAASSFDAGDDNAALSMISTELIPKIKAFFGFCASLVNTQADVLDPALAERLAGLFERSNTVMKTLSKETEARNYTEIGDLLRFDFSDLVSEYGVLLAEVSASFKSSKKASLDNH